VHINNLDDLDSLELAIISINFILTVIEPTISVSSGALIYYFYKNRKIRMKYVLMIIFISMTIALYIIPIIDMFLVSKGFDNSKITPTVGFILGLFGKSILDLLLNNTSNILKYFINKVVK
jgi:hypothetical protein